MRALLAAGYRVGANYADRHGAADAFATRTGIPVFSWNVADLAACADGVARVVAALGPIDVLVNNAGITRDAMLHKMSADQWRNMVPALAISMCTFGILRFDGRWVLAGWIVGLASMALLGGALFWLVQLDFGSWPVFPR